MHPSLSPAADLLEPLGLEELDAAAALLDRVDSKYVMPADRLVTVLAGLPGIYRVLELDGRRSFGYRTTYFDTAALATFRAHVQQRRRRFKARVRDYVDSGRCTFEVKLKGVRGRTIKRRMAYDAGLVDHLAEPAAAFLAHCLDRQYGQTPPEPMAPSLSMSFERVTLVAERLGERVTIDTSLTFASPGGERAAMPRRVAIVESKSADGRAALDRALSEAGVRPEPSCSKYCLGIAMVRSDIHAGTFRPLLRRHFGLPRSGLAPAAPAQLAASGWSTRSA